MKIVFYFYPNFNLKSKIMKKLLLPLFGIVVFGVFFSSCDGLTEMDPLEYNETVVTYYDKLDGQLVEIINAVYDDEATVADLQNEIDYCQTIIDMNLPKLKDMKPLSDDPGFLDATIDFYETAQDLLDTKYQEIMDIYTDSSDWTDEKGERVDDLVDEILDELVDGENDVTGEQKKFADAYDIQLI